MAAKKSALPKRVRVVKYFETLSEKGEKVCVSPSDMSMEAPKDEAFLKELLDGGLVISVDEAEEESSEEEGGD